MTDQQAPDGSQHVSNAHSRANAIYAAATVILVAVVYFPITRVYFWGDDFLHLFNIADRGVLAFVLEPYGGHMYVARNIVFCLFYWLFGLHPLPYQISVLVTHLVNVVLLFGIVRRFSSGPAIAALGATLWGTSP